MVRTTVVVITWRGRGYLRECLEALAAQDREHRTLVIDNASDDGTAELLARYPVEVLRLPTNTGYAGGLAAALPTLDTPFMAWLNDDAAPEPGWLAALEDALDATPD
ncbi:MAG: glycosyltransferase family 2 protein, partial [Sciscionella sp.]